MNFDRLESVVRLANRDFRLEFGILNCPDKGHDRALWGAGFVGVADGATPLGAGWPDAGSFAQSALAALQTAARRGLPSPQELWAVAIRDAATREPAPQPLVSCSAAVVRELGSELEASVLGDCMAMIQTTRHRIELHDPAVQYLDTEVLESETTGRATRRLRNRKLMNSPSGYWIFAKDPAAAAHVRSARIDVKDVVEILLHTDGLMSTMNAQSRALTTISDIVSSALNTCRTSFTDDACFIHLQAR